jgi:hypothetical protein
MFADEQLNQLAARKELVRARIGLRRLQMSVTAGELARPLALVDRGLELWRQFSPLLKVVGIPLGLLGLRRMFGRSRASAGGQEKGKGWIGVLLSALPILLEVFRTFSTASKTPAGGASP